MNIPLHNFSSDDESSVPFKMITLNTRSHYDTSVPHRHNYYEIFIFFKGGGTHEIDFNSSDIQSNSIHFVSPGQVHQVKRELDTYGYVILFSRDFYSMHNENKDILFELPFLNNNSTNPIINLQKDEIVLFEDVINSMNREAGRKDLNREKIIRNYLQILLLLSHRFYKEEGSSVTISEIVKQFRILLEKNFTTLHKVKDYARLLHVSEKTLNDTLKKNTGLTASEHVFNRLILEAKRLIKHSGLNTKEIAYYLNYEDPAHFSKFFKQKTGFTPGEFRLQ